MGTNRVSRGRTTTVKSGCATCKKRKVKCDEGFPACRRCVSTGRVCEGYRVWGGGGNNYQDRPRDAGPDALAVALTTEPSRVAGEVGGALFEWYRCRTATKIPGAFFSNFWTTLLPQASHTEPAILHALLALSATHWDGTMQYGVDKKKVTGKPPQKMERFSLEHYNQAIHYLNDKSPSQPQSARRVALITCLIFISIDLLRGHFSTAQFHLHSGLKLLGYASLPGLGVPDNDESPDNWISEVFSRLLIQFELFGQSYDYPYVLLEPANALPKATRFSTLKEAWTGLQNLTNAAFALQQHARRLKAQSKCPEQDKELMGRQQRLLAGLQWWSSMHELSRCAVESSSSRELIVAFRVLHTHEVMATIMAEVSLTPDDEMVFDTQTDQFLRLTHAAMHVWEAAGSDNSRSWSPPGQLADMNRAIVDMGWIPPLYYMATKCRNHRMRLQAVRLLENSVHREGIFDSEIVASIARKIIQIEEGELYKDVTLNDGFDINDSPTEDDLASSTVPLADRLRGVQIRLCGSPLDQVYLYCQDDDVAGGQVCIAVFDVAAQHWHDLPRA